MKIKNRVFFSSENDALENGFRPCGDCMKVKYREWRNDAEKKRVEPSW